MKKIKFLSNKILKNNDSICVWFVFISTVRNQVNKSFTKRDKDFKDVWSVADARLNIWTFEWKEFPNMRQSDFEF